MAKETPKTTTPKTTVAEVKNGVKVNVVKTFAVTHNGEEVSGKEGETVTIERSLATHLEGLKVVKKVPAPAAPSAPGNPTA